jgi:hypothetical protein
MDETNFQQAADQAAAFQKIWMDSVTHLMQSSMAGTGSGSPPPEVVRQMREGVFRALASSWDEFMRSPQFLQSMKEWMENAVNFRKMTNELLGKVRNEVQAPSREDIDAILVSLRHLEERVLDTFGKFSTDIREIKQALQTRQGSRSPTTGSPRRAPKPAAGRGEPRPSGMRSNGKGAKS